MSELRRQVAEVVGWTALTPEGHDEWLMWEQGYGIGGVPPSWMDAHGYARLEVPDYTSDDGACLDALDALDGVTNWTVQRYRNPEGKTGYSCEIEARGDNNFTIYKIVIDYGETRREAMIAALLVWHKRGER